MPNGPDSPTIQTALRDMEQRLLDTFNAGHAALTAAIAALTDMHHRAMLEQEKRNSEFARRDRLDDIARRVDQHDGQLARLVHIEQSIDNLTQAIAEVEKHVGAQGMKLVGGATGYLVTLIIVMSSVLITYLLTHGAH